MLLFLDVDGVLNSSKTRGEVYAIEDDLLQHVATLVRTCASAAHTKECHIVLTSAWRLNPAAMEVLVASLHRVKLELYSCTLRVPVHARQHSQKYAARCYARCLEITMFLTEHAPVEHEWMVLDDMHLYMDSEIKKRLIRTRRDDGFTSDNLTQALLLLQRITNKSQ